MNTNSETTDPQNQNPFRQVDRRYITLSRLTGLIAATVFSGALLVGGSVYFLTQDLNWISWVVAGLAIASTLFLFTMAIIWPALSYRRLRWRLSETGLEIHRGVLWRHQISIPVARVQHADVAQGPLQRQFGLGTLIVHTAGTQNSSIELDGLKHEFAVQLRNEIVKQKEQADVV